MQKISILIVCLCFGQISYCQVIKGKVLDSSTKKEIASASVYFNGTFVGTKTNEAGNFELDISKNTHMPLTVSAIGYFSVKLDKFNDDKPIEIMLSPKTYTINEAKVNAKSLLKKRKMCLKLFREEFLGDDYKSMRCEILNENDITFNYDSDMDTLKAFARKPLLIDNKGLGYTVTCYLDKFEYYWKNSGSLFEGNLIFIDKTAENARKQSYDNIRQTVYLESRMYFFRTLCADSLNTYPFIITNKAYQILKNKDFIIQFNGNKYLSYPEPLTIRYGTTTSHLVFLKKFVYFSESGYFDGSGINWRGEMGIQRIADRLPYEYIPIPPSTN